ncbi:MAG: putative monovalent cation/H+ antiporter subunit A [Dehalococcoidia bacterium]
MTNGLLIAVFSLAALAGIAPLLHRVLGRRAAIAMAALPAALFVYFFSFSAAIEEGETFRASLQWIPSLNLAFTLNLDGLSQVFALLITGIGALILIYASAYLGEGEHRGRFYSFLLVFMASMLGLVLSDNIITLFVFWELTSISSYALIGFEHTRDSARKSALQALLVTSGGGLVMLAGLILLAFAGGSWSLSDLAQMGGELPDHALALPALLMIAMGAFTKSAQFPFHFWLPNAMAAPTPVSAYLHSATMVKAGVYLLARLHPALGEVALWTPLLMTFGGSTMLLTAWLALRESDIKRVLAFSTVSALGTLVFLLGLGSSAAIKAAMVFLVGHALYKGALFMLAGGIDHETGTRDLTRLSGLRRAMPITAVAAVLAAISMAGIPPALGFMGKETLYDATLHAGSGAALLAAAALVTGVLTMIAAGYVGLRPFIGPVSETPRHAHQGSPGLWAPPLFLAALGIAFGFLATSLAVRIFEPAVAVVYGQPASVELVFWPGFGTVVVMSVATILVGTVGSIYLHAIRRLVARLTLPERYSTAAAYDALVESLKPISEGHTLLLQSGYLRRYITTILLTTTILVGSLLLFNGGLAAPSGWADARFHEVAIAFMILAAAGMAALTKSRLRAVVALGASGYGVALVYMLFGAPDLAMTQFFVETLTVILFVSVFRHIPTIGQDSPTASRIRDAFIAVAAGAVMTALVWAVLDVPVTDSVSNFYRENSYVLAHGRNVVNTILVDFRGLDTMGEIAVLATAAIGVVALLRLLPGREGRE